MTARSVMFAIAALLASGIAAAHTGTGLGAGFGSGLLHPIVGWDHLLAAVAVGLWAARHPSRTALMLPLVFLGAMTTGIVLGLGGAMLPGAEPAILGSLIVFGGALVLKRRIPAGLAAAVLALFAVFHGNAHGAEMPIAARLFTYGSGLLLATAILHGTGILAGRLAHPLVLRWVGVAIGSVGLWMLAAG
ncbi:HupE/UreJ family protein [Thiohalomonas denitrificans]|uniref:HupE/UreJ family protein n=1 Tax=Thiohalomonas denitrificans TaxID=415747 RepID=UPI0026F01B6C|nr:HupE/UreJ family protein [Thiohalomonas denitrificans]